MDVIAAHAARIPEAPALLEGDRRWSWAELLTRRNDLAARVNRDVQMHARLQVWLYLHVPLTAALLATLAAHIIAVFLYR